MNKRKSKLSATEMEVIPKVYIDEFFWNIPIYEPPPYVFPSWEVEVLNEIDKVKRTEIKLKSILTKNQKQIRP